MALEDFKPKVLKPDRARPTKGTKGRVLQLNITESWGDLFYVGLNGIEVLDGHMEPISLDLKHLNASPRDMNSIPGHR